MKRYILTIIAAAAIVSASAMSYSQAREQAWFLTDKMAYELYLSTAQMDAVYEINLDYIMNVDFAGDVFGTYWERRTRELSFVLTNSQMHTFLAREYFYRPITWVNSTFRFAIYDRYPRTVFYSTAPRVYTTYRGEYRHSTGSRFEGKFHDMKPSTTGRTLSTRTGASTATSNTGSGFTNPRTTRKSDTGSVRTGSTRSATTMTTGSTRSAGSATTMTTGSTRSAGSATTMTTGSTRSTSSATTMTTGASISNNRTRPSVSSAAVSTGSANSGSRRH